MTMRETVAKQRPMIDLEQFERRLRQTDPGARAAGDPLAELARLAGERDDPYKTVFEQRPPARREAGETAAFSEGGDEDFDYRELRAPGRDVSRAQPPARLRPEGLRPDRSGQERAAFSRDDSAYLPAADFDAGASVRRPAPAAPYEDFDDDFNAGYRRPVAPQAARAPEREAPSYARAAEPDDDFTDYPTSFDQDAQWRYPDEAAYAAEPDNAPPRSKRPLYVMAAVILLGVGGVAASFALRGGTGSREVATIKAHDGPVKIQPENTGANDARSENPSILERTPQAAPVAVADGAEQPIDLSRMPDRAPRVITMNGANSGARPPAAPAQAADAGADQKTIADLIEPKKVKTVSVRPDGSVIASGHADAASPAAKAPAHATNAPKPAESRTAARPESGAGDGAYAAQLAAPSTEAEAKEIQARLVKKYGALVSGFHPVVRKAVAGDKTVYRVRVVGLSKDEATGVCQKVQGAGGACFVARN